MINFEVSIRNLSILIKNMAFNAIVAITVIGILHSPGILAQTSTPSSSTTSSIPSSTSSARTDPFSTGKWGNPGARAFVCGRSLEAIHNYASDLIARALEALSVLDHSVNLGAGTLTVKPPRVTEASYGRSEYRMVPPNRVHSRFFDGRLRANGVWQFKPVAGNMIGGKFQTTVSGMELNATNQLGRTSDAKPMVQVVDCKANISEYRIDIEGSTDMQTIDDCKLDVCMKIRKFFQDAICDVYGNFIKEIVNRELQAYPTRVTIYDDQQKVDYGLMSNQPTVNDKCIHVGMEGRYIWRGGSAVPFYPTEMQWVDNRRMLSFQLSDFTFNTLLHQTHMQGYRFSAADLIETSPAIQQHLGLNCSNSKFIIISKSQSPTPVPTTKTTPKSRKYRGPKPPAKHVRGGETGRAPGPAPGPPKCLGDLFENVTTFGPFDKSDIGDIVYRSGQRASNILVQAENGGIFDGSNGVLEFFGPAGHGGSRPLLTRVDVRLLRAEFTAKLNKANITGTVKIIQLELSQPPPQNRMFTPDWLIEAAQFVTPILNDMINDFLTKYAQFSIPLPEKYQCTSPQFSVLPRTMQIDCDVQTARPDGCDHCHII